MKDLVACDTNRQNRNYENIELWINDEVRGSQQFAGLREYGKKFQESPKNSSPRRASSSHSLKASTVLPMFSAMWPR